MARVTVEDCVIKIPNRFDLVMLAAQRARNIAAGAALTVDQDNDKMPVIALREIADETINLDVLHENLVKGLQRFVESDEGEAEVDEDLIESEAIELGAEMAGVPVGEVEFEDGAADDEMDIGDEAAVLDAAGDPLSDLGAVDGAGAGPYVYEDEPDPED